MAHGITYFRLKSEYPGDITKNCGLTGVEVDSNFHFLEGKDVKSLTISDDGKDLVITLLDGTTIIGEGIMEAAKDELSFSFDPSTGVLTIIHNGETQEIPGFNTVPGLSIVYTDDSLKGDGTPSNPLGLSKQYYPGTKKAVISIIDGDTGELPENPNIGDRYLVKKHRIINGTLYNKEGLDEIKSMLNSSGSEWRIPTVDDWNCLKEGLLECIAGKMIKANGKWPDGNTDDMYGFTAYPSGYSYEIGGDVIGYGNSAMFATASLNESGDGAVASKSMTSVVGRIATDEPGRGWGKDKDLNNFGVSENTTGKGVSLDGSRGKTGGGTTSGGSGDGYEASYPAPSENPMTSVVGVRQMLYEMLNDGNNEIIEIEGDRILSSLRFVKDYNGNNYHNYDIVLGDSVRTCLVPSCDGIYHVWTAESSNIETESGSYVPEIYNNDKVLNYSICEWDGVKWNSSNLDDYESVFVIDQSCFLCRLGEKLYTSTEKWTIFE